MKSHSRALAALVLSFLLILHSSIHGAQATRLLLTKAQLATTDSSSHALKDLQAAKKDPSKQVDSSFQKIPPSRSNPTQNKSKPP